MTVTYVDKESLADKIFSPTFAYALAIFGFAVCVSNDLGFLALIFPALSDYRKEIFNTSGWSLVFYNGILLWTPRDFWDFPYALASAALIGIASVVHFLTAS